MNSLTEESQPGFFQRIFHHQAVYVNLISSIIYGAASRDNVVLRGRGGQFLLANRPNVINARIIAPLDFRISIFQKQQNIDSNIAEELVRKRDRDRSGFIRYLFEKDVSEPDGYDIILNTQKFDVESTAEILTAKAKVLSKEYPFSPGLRDTYTSLALQALVQVTLQKRMPDSNYIKVKASPEGDITLSGYIATHPEKSEAEALAKAVSGVKSVKNDIHVAHFPVTSWP
ncbi:MAG: cytidylate kinase family protein [Deltaproteobacteria bacterium]|nr:cytidylate kinase family protein [Deltaproteobacteria bacterium]